MKNISGAAAEKAAPSNRAAFENLRATSSGKLRMAGPPELQLANEPASAGEINCAGPRAGPGKSPRRRRWGKRWIFPVDSDAIHRETLFRGEAAAGNDRGDFELIEQKAAGRSVAPCPRGLLARRASSALAY